MSQPHASNTLTPSPFGRNTKVPAQIGIQARGIERPAPYNPHLNFYITGDALDAEFPNDVAKINNLHGKGISKAFAPNNTILDDLIARKITGHDRLNEILSYE